MDAAPEQSLQTHLLPHGRFFEWPMYALIRQMEVERCCLVPAADLRDRRVRVEIGAVSMCTYQQGSGHAVTMSILSRGHSTNKRSRAPVVDVVNNANPGALVEPHVLLAAGGGGVAVASAAARGISPMIILGPLSAWAKRTRQLDGSRRLERSESHGVITPRYPTWVSKPREAGRWSIVW